jgi:GGDEF domain-containing protein
LDLKFSTRGFLPWSLHALVLMLLTASGWAAAATDPSRVWPDRKIAAEYWLDGSGTATLEAAHAQFEANRGLAADPRQIMPLGGGRAVWYRLQLPIVAAPTPAVFSVPYPGMDNVELFRPDGKGGWRAERAGDSRPVNEWPIRYLYPAFSLTVQPAEMQATYFRVQHSHPIGITLELWDAGSFAEAGKIWHLILGAYVGFMALVILLSVTNAVSWRDPIHLYYALHVAFVGLSLMSLNGLAGEYLWPGNAWWNDIAAVALPSAALAGMGLFVRELAAERGRVLVSRLLLAHVAISLLMMLSIILFGRSNRFVAFNIYAVLGLALMLGVMVWYSLRRPQAGLFVLAGLAALTAGIMFPVMRNIGLLPITFGTQYAPQIGGALEIPLVLIGLYLRSRERRDNRLRLDGLFRSDPLTGLANHRVLVDRLQLLLRRAGGDAAIGAVMRVHVANLSAIRNEHGREAAEAALVRAAECVARAANEGDTVAREQGGDLVLLLEGRATREQIAYAGRDIIARGLKFSSLLPPGVMLMLHVGVMGSPLPEGNATQLLAMLADVIREIGSDPHGRALRIVGAADPSAVAQGGRDMMLSAGSGI